MVNKLGDTFASCCYQSVLTHNYLTGKGKPHFPVPVPLEYDPADKHPQKLVDYASIRSACVSYAGY